MQDTVHLSNLAACPEAINLAPLSDRLQRVGPLCPRPVSLPEGQKMECLEHSYTLTLSAPKYTISKIYSAVAITILKNVQS